MAAAYAAIANDGVYIQPTFYAKIVDFDGNVVREASQETRKVLSSAASYVVKELLTEPVKNGTATQCTISEMSVAAKTGTTTNDYDRWLCGFTPYYTAATWFGYDKNETVKFPGLNPASLIWIEIMRPLHSSLDPQTFAQNMPDTVITQRTCKSSGLLATSRCGSRIYTEFFVIGTEPTKYCNYHTNTGGAPNGVQITF